MLAQECVVLKYAAPQPLSRNRTRIFRVWAYKISAGLFGDIWELSSVGGGCTATIENCKGDYSFLRVMTNSLQHATDWLSFLMEQELPFGEALRSQMRLGRVGELCNCGCQGFAFEVAPGSGALPLQQGAGVFYELAFTSNFPEEIDILLFTDEHGYLDWIDVTYGACNIEPMPEGIVPMERIGIWPGTRTR